MNYSPASRFIMFFLAATTFPFLVSQNSQASLAAQKSISIIPVWQIAQATTPKPRIAILDFDYSSVSDPRWVGIFGGGAKGISDILVNQLVESGEYSVVERSRLDAILQEQNLGTTGRIDPTTAAQLGRLLGVDAVVIGSITQFDLQTKQSGLNIPFVSTSTKETDAYVQLNVRMINTTSGEIITVAEGKGHSNQSDSSTTVIGVGGNSSTSNDGLLLTNATKEATKKIAETLNEKASTVAALPKALPTVSAVVAGIDGSNVILNKGSQDGYRPGLKVSIEQVTQEIRDPQTKKILRTISKPIGLVEIIEVDAQSSVARIVSGSKFKVGNLAKPTQ